MVRQQIIARLSHGNRGLIPTVTRLVNGTNHDLAVLDVEADFVSEAALFQQNLWDSDPARIADSNYPSPHRHKVITRGGIRQGL